MTQFPLNQCWVTRRFGELINEKKHKMRGGYKKRGKK